MEAYPLKPDFYASTREPIRRALRAQTEVEWTLFNVGWLADYFLPASKSFMTPNKDTFPIDVDGWKACVRGTGDEAQSWTAARDVGRAVVELCKSDTWVSGRTFTSACCARVLLCFRPPRKRLISQDPQSAKLMGAAAQERVTYVAGEWNTFNQAIEIVESFYGNSGTLPVLFQSPLRLGH